MLLSVVLFVIQIFNCKHCTVRYGAGAHAGIALPLESLFTLTKQSEGASGKKLALVEICKSEIANECARAFNTLVGSDNL